MLAVSSLATDGKGLEGQIRSERAETSFLDRPFVAGWDARVARVGSRGRDPCGWLLQKLEWQFWL